MKGINIILYFSNTKYADSLARGLCYECTGLNVFFAYDKETVFPLIDRGILLTDMDLLIENKTILFSSKAKEDDKICLSKTCPLNQIIRRMKTIALREYGVHLYSMEENRRVIGVFSQKGGIGVTSFAIILARLISAYTELKVLYLNFGLIDDYEQYSKIENYEGILTKKHFIFTKKEGIKTNIENYIKKDHWNVHYFREERNYNSFYNGIEPSEIIDMILEEKYFSYIIVDFGKRRNLDSQILNSIEVRREEIVFSDNGGETFKSYDRQLEGESLLKSIDRFIEESEIIY